MLNEPDLRLLRMAIALSARARERGNAPYGAVLADERGEVILEAQNTQVVGRDCTGHAELNLMREASHRFDAAALARCTVYASGEPCPMCAGAIYWGGVRRVVYSLSVPTMARLAGPASDEMGFRLTEVLARCTQPVEVIGPELEGEASQAYGA